MSRRMHHLAMGANDPERVANFYSNLLGLRELKRHHYDDGRLRSVWLDLGGAVLMVEHTEARRAPVVGVGAGPFLVAVGVEADGREDLERALEGAGHAIEARTEFSSYTRDPEGNRVAISTYPLELDP